MPRLDFDSYRRNQFCYTIIEVEVAVSGPSQFFAFAGAVERDAVALEEGLDNEGASSSPDEVVSGCDRIATAEPSAAIVSEL